MLIGYARTSTTDQEAGLAAQVRDLEHEGCEKVFSEQTGGTGSRPQLQAALAFARPRDALVVTKPDRLARSLADLLAIEKQLREREIGLVVISLGLDTRACGSLNPTSKLMLSVLGAIAEFERSLMLERQREGVAAAQRAGKYKGRAPTARRQGDEVRRLAAEGVGPTEIASRLNMSRMSVWRILHSEPAEAA